MKDKTKLMSGLGGDHSRLSDITKSLDALADAIKADKQGLFEIASPLDLMLFRAEKAEAALKASEIALEALQILQKNSLEIIKAGDIALAAMKATISEGDQDAHLKQKALDELTKVIEKNAINLKASALALSAVNELAFNDPLTGLPNRRLLNDRLQQMIIKNKRWETYSAAVFLDLDKFKRLNDEFGHEAGDELLIAVGKRLQSSVRESDTVARYGGDEFVILLNRLNGNLLDARTEAEAVTTKILTALMAPYSLHVHADKGTDKTNEGPEVKSIEYQCFASLGVVMFDGDVAEENNILDWADEAMYWAKSEGGRTIRFYDAANSAEQTLMNLYDMATQNDIETANHGIRTRQYVKTLAHRAQQMNLFPGELNDQIIERLFKTTQLHDIGKTKIPYVIIHKKEKLTPEEWVIMKTHTTFGAEILEEAKKQNASLTDFLNTAIEIAIAHHEHWDGSGYPKSLSGFDIPLAGRIMAIVDVYDALISKRSYKEPWSHQDAMAEITSKSGTQFDPLLIEALKRESDNFRLIAESAKD
ncbi:diguanylate cyclase (GGDEF)-like protein [Polynucleobacter sphagniphilus]|uniref:diguanylate cyclase domain-containing protein n=1 Tax=Polynucleobacter sphagniphilus TaxID=1743169 RepID=UPI0024732ABB|nr:diguanylate cyclase [Polynucleobacter sphagniphilus]MDH6420460.1 diguanylate cyclase (GGDEF)-like protein [Polynucleobacter sphagniphilus]